MNKQEVVSKVALTEKDTGSPEVQVSSADRSHQRAERSTAKKNPNDHQPLPRPDEMVGRRRNLLLAYLQKKDIERYRALIATLGSA